MIHLPPLPLKIAAVRSRVALALSLYELAAATSVYSPNNIHTTQDAISAGSQTSVASFLRGHKCCCPPGMYRSRNLHMGLTKAWTSHSHSIGISKIFLKIHKLTANCRPSQETTSAFTEAQIGARAPGHFPVCGGHCMTHAENLTRLMESSARARSRPCHHKGTVKVCISYTLVPSTSLPLSASPGRGRLWQNIALFLESSKALNDTPICHDSSGEGSSETEAMQGVGRAAKTHLGLLLG